MTALKPCEARDVVAVASQRYPVNKQCSAPDCTEKATNAHHCFPRSYINGDSYFVSIEGGEPIPHAVGLCGSGTTGHHGDVEEHRAWIKYEDGEWSWYERLFGGGIDPHGPATWELVGPLNPQPGSVEAKPKRRKFQGEAKRKRANWQVSVPKDQIEDGAGIADDLFEQVIEKLAKEMDKEPSDGTAYTWLIAAFAKMLMA